MSLQRNACDSLKFLRRCLAFFVIQSLLTSCVHIANELFSAFGDRYIDKTGKEVIRGPFAEAYGFSNGLARVRSFEGGYGFIDHNGELVIEPQFYDASDFSEGLAVVNLRRDIRTPTPNLNRGPDPNSALDKKGYVDRDGNLVIRPQFFQARDFSEGLAWVVLATTHPKSGYIDKTGKFVIRTDVGGGYVGGQFREGLAPVLDQSQHKWGFMNKSGKLAIAPKYDLAFGFSEGLARVVFQGHTGFIDRQGRFVVRPEYESVDWPKSEFSDGMAAVKRDGKWGYVDKTGKEVIKPQFDRAGDFADGLAVVYVESSVYHGVSWVINKAGHKVFMDESYCNFGDFSEGLLATEVNDRWGYVDKTGEMIIAPNWRWVDEFHEGLAVVK